MENSCLEQNSLPLFVASFDLWSEEIDGARGYRKLVLLAFVEKLLLIAVTEQLVVLMVTERLQLLAVQRTKVQAEYEIYSDAICTRAFATNIVKFRQAFARLYKRSDPVLIILLIRFV